MSPEVLAEVTAVECFNEADSDGDGLLNEQEFKKWILMNDPSLGGGAPPGTVASQRLVAAAVFPSSFRRHPVCSSFICSAASIPGVERYRKLLCLNEYSPDEVIETFKENSYEGLLDRTGFKAAVEALVTLGGGDFNALSENDLRELFDLFDADSE